jgi:hypothetical protein
MWIETGLGLAGICAALILILVLRQARVEVRSLRLAVLAERSHAQNIRLGKILIAENAKLVAKGVDHGALFLNAGQRTVANLTYGILELIPATREKARTVREKHMQIGEGITENIRKAPRRHKRRRAG